MQAVSKDVDLGEERRPVENDGVSERTDGAALKQEGGGSGPVDPTLPGHLKSATWRFSL